MITGGLQGRTRTTSALIAGGSLGDFVYCSITMLGLAHAVQATVESLVVRIVFGVAITAWGVRILRTRIRISDDPAPPRLARVHGSFWAGILVSLLNPWLITSWLVIGGALHASGAIGDGTTANLAFAVGAAFGMASWLYLLLYLLARHRQRIPVNGLTWLVRAFGVLLIGTGVYCFVGTVASLG